MTLIQNNNTKNHKHVSNFLSCCKNILLLSANFDLFYSGQGNNPKDINELFTRNASKSGYGGIYNYKKKP